MKIRYKIGSKIPRFLPCMEPMDIPTKVNGNSGMVCGPPVPIFECYLKVANSSILTYYKTSFHQFWVHN